MHPWYILERKLVNVGQDNFLQKDTAPRVGLTVYVQSERLRAPESR